MTSRELEWNFLGSELVGRSIEWLIHEWTAAANKVANRGYDGTAFSDLAYALAKHGDEGAEFLKSRLDSSHAYEVVPSIEMLPISTLPSAVQRSLLRDFLTNQDPQIRATTIDSLRLLHDKEPYSAILRMLHNDETRVQTIALKYISKIEPEVGLAEARRRLRSVHPVIRATAIDTIDELDSVPQSDEPWLEILPLIGDADPDVRAAARWYLSSRSCRLPIHSAELSSDLSEFQRAATVALLTESDPSEAVRLYSADPSELVRQALSDVLSESLTP